MLRCIDRQVVSAFLASVEDLPAVLNLLGLLGFSRASKLPCVAGLMLLRGA